VTVVVRCGLLRLGSRLRRSAGRSEAWPGHRRVHRARQLVELLIGELHLRGPYVVFQVRDRGVPGIGRIAGERRKSQARASCEGLASRSRDSRSSTLPSETRLPVASGHQG